MHVIDTHVHFYDTDRPEGLAWPHNAVESALPTNFLTELHDLTPARVIAIETSQRYCDDVWLLDLAASTPIIGGVILNLLIESPEFHVNLESAMKHDKFKGIRLRPIRKINLRNTQLRQRLDTLPATANIVEAGCPTSSLLRQFTKLASQLPGLQFVLDHAGHPVISGDRPDRNWLDSINSAASVPNLAVKIAGLAQFSRGQVKHSQFYAPTLDALLNAFGKNRILFGSNWPVVKTSGGYQANRDIITCHFQNTPSVLANIMHLNAQRIYKLRSPTQH